jgi:hypothetical protein
MEDFWGVGKTQEKQGLQKMKGDIKGVYDYGKKKVALRKKFIKVKIEKAQARKVLDYMDRNYIEYEL